ncbi:LacI family transcriptional regulator, partial [Vitellibacter sp. q18]|nr:LacI family transcriptional regulator [Aequorivita lutea]
HEAMKNILNRSIQQPTAVFAVTDRLAIGAMSYLKEQGLETPQDMALVGIGASELSQYVDPPLTTVDYKNESAGEEAAKQLLAHIQGKEYQKKLVLDYRLILRDSV